MKMQRRQFRIGELAKQLKSGKVCCSILGEGV